MPVGALASLGLARSYALQPAQVACPSGRENHGDTTVRCPCATAGRPRQGPRRPTRTFFTLWKDADPDIPILKQAKAEYAKLKAQLRRRAQ